MDDTEATNQAWTTFAGTMATAAPTEQRAAWGQLSKDLAGTPDVPPVPDPPVPTVDLPPTVTLTAPLDGASVSGTMAVHADATDDHGVLECWLQVDGIELATSDDFVAPYDWQVDTSAYPDGTHVLTVVAKDTGAQKFTSRSVKFNVTNKPGTVEFPSVAGRAPTMDELVSESKLRASWAKKYPTALKVSGSITNPTPGDLGLAIQGTLVITKPGTYRHFKVTSGDYFPIQCRVDGVVLEDFEVVGTGPGPVGIGGWGVFRRGLMSGMENAFNIEGTSEVDRCVIVRAHGSPDAHIDGIQNDGSKLWVHHSYIDMADSVPGAVSAVMNDNYFGDCSGSITEYSYLASGSYPAYFDGRFNPGKWPTTGCALRYNRIRKGQYGYYTIGTATADVKGNIDATTGAGV